MSGVDLIKYAQTFINRFFKIELGDDAKQTDYVIYVDTDSCFMSAISILI